MGIFTWLKKILTYDPSVYKPPVDKTTDSEGMSEGDFHSGPDGYSPNTSYPDTFYGSGGEREGGHDEGDFNR
jgi:hypothetical protein